MGNLHSKRMALSRKCIRLGKKHQPKVMNKSDEISVPKVSYNSRRTSCQYSLPRNPKQLLSNVNNGDYLLPVSEDEHDRLINDHYTHRMTWGRNFMSPIEEVLREGAKVLDVGCGSGTWMFEVATEFPESVFIGIDITPFIPMIRPPNVKFEHANFLNKLAFDDETFDFVHVRGICMGLTRQHWEPLINELVRVTKIGGYIELGERDTQWIGEGLIGAQMRSHAVKEILERRDIDLIPTPLISRTLNAHLCLDEIFHEARQEKLGIWGGKAGELQLQRLIWLITNVKTELLDAMSMESEEFDQILNALMNEFQGRKAYEMSHRYWSQRMK